MNLKTDRYRKNRGGYSRLLNLYCRKCNRLIATYQKDGPGNLRRLYLDRISYPKELVGLQNQPLEKIKILNCKCGEMLGTPYIYKKENRKAYKLYQDSIIKKIKKLN
jgi:hypothetical protein